MKHANLVDSSRGTSDKVKVKLNFWKMYEEINRSIAKLTKKKQE
jgi:hypothetical protein